jgi:hypothetical protein
VRALEDPICDVLAAVRPEEAKTDTMQSFVDAHVASGWGGMVGREDVATKRERDNNQHQQFRIVLDRLKNGQFAFDKG